LTIAEPIVIDHVLYVGNTLVESVSVKIAAIQTILKLRKMPDGVVIARSLPARIEIPRPSRETFEIMNGLIYRRFLSFKA
jgi:hypothetical protein